MENDIDKTKIEIDSKNNQYDDNDIEKLRIENLTLQQALIQLIKKDELVSSLNEKVNSLIRKEKPVSRTSRAADNHTMWGGIYAGIGFSIIIGSVAFPKNLAFGLLFIGFFIIVGGVLLILAATLYKKALDKDDSFADEVDKIGDYIVPFGKKWKMQCIAGRNNRHYIFAQYVESSAIIIFFASLFIGIIYGLIQLVNYY